MNRLPIRFHRESLLWALLILIVEVLIATVWSQHRLLRSFGGDVLAAVWVYCVLKMIVKAPIAVLAAAAFAVGCVVELGQLAAAEAGWRPSHALVRMVLGSVADWRDVAAYAVGAVLVAVLDGARGGSQSPDF